MFGKKEKKSDVTSFVSNGVELGLYSLRDKFTEEFNPPFVMKSDKLAIRAFSDWLKNKKDVSLDDFDLFFVGTIDIHSGIVNGAPLRYIDMKEVNNG